MTADMTTDFNNKVDSGMSYDKMPGLITHEKDQRVFWLDTDHTSYVFRITAYGHPEHIYYGPKLVRQPVDALALKRSAVIGASVLYEPSDPLYCLDHLCLEWSGIGKGDYRYSPAEIKMPDGSFTNDLVYRSYHITSGCVPPAELPHAKGDEGQTLEIVMTDQAGQIALSLYYTVFAQTDVIARHCVLKNLGREPDEISDDSASSDSTLVIRRLMSMMFDMPDQGYRLITLDGDWIKEAHRHERQLMPGMYVNSSATGASSNRHNPGLILASERADENHGMVYGFNLIYSGNHFGCAELSPFGLVRVMLGINPHCFEWELKAGDSFTSPQAVMTCSDQGFHGMSRHFHDFINRHIVPQYWQGRERPVLYNSWEAHFFKFNERKLMKTARLAGSLGIELFVLDDGWFGKRNDDQAGLGYYQVNKRKFPHGLAAFSRRLNRLGMDFGLWFEPEMVNEDSKLYREHPDWAVRIPGRRPSYGRNQLVLDLCNPRVRDYIVTAVGGVMDDASVSYVKWDMNRHISDAYSAFVNGQGEFFHRYILGLYDVLGRIFEPRPQVLLETCSSGGNRFDLGMLSFGPQVWVSDCTDPIERLAIQGGLSYLYPPSAFGAHVSDAPHQQTLRLSPLSSRFHASCFGCLGYELELKYLSRMERAEIREQIAFYKLHRNTLQFGRFRRLTPVRAGTVQWQCTDDDDEKAVAGHFQVLTEASPGYDILALADLADDRRYRVTTKPQRLFVKRFGSLIKHVLPFSLNPDGLLLRMVNRVYALNDCVEAYAGDGRLLKQGIVLNNQFMGSHYNANTRLLGDFGSNLYLVAVEGGPMKEGQSI